MRGSTVQSDRPSHRSRTDDFVQELVCVEQLHIQMIVEMVGPAIEFLAQPLSDPKQIQLDLASDLISRKSAGHVEQPKPPSNRWIRLHLDQCLTPASAN